MKKYIYLLLTLIILCNQSYGQNGKSVGIGTLNPESSAVLHLESIDQGLLMPRLNTSQITGINNATDGLILYNADDGCFWFYKTATWTRICNTDDLYDSLANMQGDISNLYDSISNIDADLSAIYDSLAIHNMNIYNNSGNINNLYDSVTIINGSITNIYDSLSLYSVYISGNTTNINNLYDSIMVINTNISFIYDTLTIYNTNIINNSGDISNLYDSVYIINNNIFSLFDSVNVINTSISNLYDSVSVINNELDVIDSTLSRKWDLSGNTGTTPGNDFMGTTDARDFVLKTNLSERFRITASGALLYSDTLGTTPASGPGTRLMWIPSKKAFRAGEVTGDQWDDANIGHNSFAIGRNSKASGTSSVAMGGNMAEAIGNNSFAMGNGATANGMGAFALAGNIASVNGDFSFGMGNGITVNNNSAFGIGNGILLGNTASFGYGNSVTVNGNFSFGIGNGILISHDRTVVISATTNQTISTASDQILLHANGGIEVYSDLSQSTGAILASGSGTWATASDRALKERFEVLNMDSVIAKYKDIEVTRWNYKTQVPNDSLNNYSTPIRHIGPMAQDYFAAFALGTDDKHITTLDISGVNMAIIQELLARDEEKDQLIMKLEERIKTLETKEMKN